MPEKSSSTSSRKADHIRINLDQDVRSGLTTGLENYRFTHQALPELNLEDVKLNFSFFGKELSAPLFISSMTGGTEKAGIINRNLATAAQETGIPMGVGSQRAALEDSSLIPTYQVREIAPDILLFANLGAVQLNYGLSVDDCRRAVQMIEADALILHLNLLQEAVMVGGNTRFSGLLDKIEGVCKTLEVPVIVKEVGWGFSSQAAKQLQNTGVKALDIAGAGGTSWTEVEMHRAETDDQRKIASAFINWGIPTAETLQSVHKAVPDLPLFASGGLKNGVDIAKCIALGAEMGGMAGAFLKAAVISPQAVINEIKRVKKELQISMFASGAGDLPTLSQSQLIKNNAS
ncbi:MAG: type 2 isopentenyl-diphosphate Delta-isomerase [Anaerolineales bacterium]|nr:type 2 isopentenyl-diphosphate Delta-isomerase [Anaerolineales bacterium]